MMDEAEYKQKWLNKEPGTDTDYNNCRFSDDKLDYAINWINEKYKNLKIDRSVSYEDPKDIVDIIIQQKLRIIADKEYRDKCRKWADKVAVQEEIKKLGYEENLIPVIDTISKEELSVKRFDEYIMPLRKYIVKTNHGSGWNYPLTGHETFNRNSLIGVVNKLKGWLDLNYAYISGYEAQYEEIEPKIIIQEKISESPTDYGFWCVNGKIECISLTRKIGKNMEEYIAFVDENCKGKDYFIGLRPAQKDLQKRQIEIIEKMKPLVNDISKEFNFVRVDLMYADGKVYFGEATLTPCSGILEISKT